MRAKIVDGFIGIIMAFCVWAMAMVVIRADQFKFKCPYCKVAFAATPLLITTNSEMHVSTPDGTNYVRTLTVQCPNPKCLKIFPAHNEKIVESVWAEEVRDIDESIKIPPPLPVLPTTALRLSQNLFRTTTNAVAMPGVGLTNGLDAVMIPMHTLTAAEVLAHYQENKSNGWIIVKPAKP